MKNYNENQIWIVLGVVAFFAVAITLAIQL